MGPELARLLRATGCVRVVAQQGGAVLLDRQLPLEPPATVAGGGGQELGVSCFNVRWVIDPAAGLSLPCMSVASVVRLSVRSQVGSHGTSACRDGSEGFMPPRMLRCGLVTSVLLSDSRLKCCAPSGPLLTPLPASTPQGAPAHVHPGQPSPPVAARDVAQG